MTRAEDSKYGKGRPLCDGKIRYATREAAARKLVKNQALYRPAQQRVYSCGKCDGWHVSSRLPRTAGDEMTSAERPLREIGPTAVPRRAAMNHAAYQEQIRALMAEIHEQTPELVICPYCVEIHDAEKPHPCQEQFEKSRAKP